MDRAFLGALYGNWMALNAYRVVAAAPDWECSPYYSYMEKILSDLNQSKRFRIRRECFRS
jgi:hypothetical protein